MTLRDEHLTIDSDLPQSPRAETLGSSEDPEDDVLCADVVVVGRARLVLGGGEHGTSIRAEAA